MEQGRHGDVNRYCWNRRDYGVPLLEFQFGCASNAEAFLPSPSSSPICGGGFDLTLMSFLQIGADGSVNVSTSLPSVHMSLPDAVDLLISPHMRNVLFSAFFNAGAQLQSGRGSAAYH